MIGGYDGISYYPNVQVIDLEDPDSECAPLINYPSGVFYPTVAYTDGRLRACGGVSTESGAAAASAACYEYDVDEETWSREERN